VDELLALPKYALLQSIVRGKGVPQAVLEENPEWYERMNRGEEIEGQLRVDPFKKCAYRLNASELANGFQQFSVHRVIRKFSVNKTRFSGHRLETAVESYPWGYEAPPISHENHYEEWMPVDTIQSVSNYGRRPVPPIEPEAVCHRPGVLETLTAREDGYALARGARMHRLVAQAFLPNPEAKTFVDHINGDRMDNRAVNLRWATPQENAANTALRSNNTSGAKGVQRNPTGTCSRFESPARVTGHIARSNRRPRCARNTTLRKTERSHENKYVGFRENGETSSQSCTEGGRVY
jgi:hypothetical protein